MLNEATKKIIARIALRFKRDKRVISAVALHPLLFFKHKQESYDDERPVRIKYLGVFVQKNKYNKLNAFKYKYKFHLVLYNYVEFLYEMKQSYVVPIATVDIAVNIFRAKNSYCGRQTQSI